MIASVGSARAEAVEDAWAVLCEDALDALTCGRPVSATDLGNLSTEATAALLTMLARDGAVRLASVKTLGLANR